MEEEGDECVAPEDCPVDKPDQECPVGMVYEECGTACPTTCDNKDELVRPCTLQCVAGKGLVRHKDTSFSISGYNDWSLVVHNRKVYKTTLKWVNLDSLRLPSQLHTG